ncbi:transposase [Frankia sp. Hr75.2]|nr:transposase [Frankia sp. Hr75.2]
MDETYAKVAGRWTYLYRAVDQHGQVIDVLAGTRRDQAAARRFFVRALSHGRRPVVVTTDKAPVYLRLLDELLPEACHVDAARENNRIEADHGWLKVRLRPMRGPKRLRSVQTISGRHALIQNIRRGHYELAIDIDPQLRLAATFTEVARAV